MVRGIRHGDGLLVGDGFGRVRTHCEERRDCVCCGGDDVGFVGEYLRVRILGVSDVRLLL